MFPFTFFDRLHLTLDASETIRYNGIIYVPHKFSMGIGIEYQFNLFKIFTKYDYINSEIGVGIKYSPSIADIWKYIF